MEQMARNHKMDNGKALLIFLVVFGHFLELFPGNFKAFLYLVIYSFHMPAFVFFSGYFAAWKPGRLFQRILYPYLCFQVLYLLFETYCLGNSFPHPFTRPYWLMWYLISMAFWYLLLPVIDRLKRFRGLFLAVTAALALLSGFLPWIGYRFGLSRTIVLFPFFLGGYLCHNSWKERLKILKEKGAWPGLLLLAAITGSILLLWAVRSAVEPDWLYHSVSYAGGHYSLWIRGLLLLNAGIWTLWLLFALPDRRIPFLSALGGHTMAVYLLHGFFIKAAEANGLLNGSQQENLLLAFLMSLLLCFLLGNPVTERVFRFLFSAKWMER
ncbi:acyltransferase family protein [Lachnospiraceae bacterium 54-53]